MLRMRRKLKAYELAQVAQTHGKTIVEAEKGNTGGVRLDTISMVCDALDIPISHVLRWEK